MVAGSKTLLTTFEDLDCSSTLLLKRKIEMRQFTLNNQVYAFSQRTFQLRIIADGIQHCSVDCTLRKH
jgi:hypothetical protein